MKAALLCCQQFVKDLKSVGFKINPCDPCLANKMVRGKQLSVVWHVNNLKVSHVSAAIFAKMADWLKSTCKRLFKDGSSKMALVKCKSPEERFMSTLE
jgi:hypothetical protein